jgi:uncharacterized peroxidase-related enzyme
MKLPKVEHDHSLGVKLKLGAMRLMTGTRPPDVVRLMLHRPELFGASFTRWIQQVLRSASEWTVGERELFAMYVSQANGCQFCLGSHHAVAARAMGADVVDAVLADFRTAPVTPQVKAALGFLDKLAKEPASVTASDVRTLRAAGIGDAGVVTLIHVTALFCTVNRIADALGFEVPSASAFARQAGPLLKFGYRL